MPPELVMRMKPHSSCSASALMRTSWSFSMSALKSPSRSSSELQRSTVIWNVAVAPEAWMPITTAWARKVSFSASCAPIKPTPVNAATKASAGIPAVGRRVVVLLCIFFLLSKTGRSKEVRTISLR